MADDDLIREARERYSEALDAELDNRSQMEEDLKFAALEQWDEQLVAERRRVGRPCLVMDRIGQVVRQVTGDARLNPPGIKVRPVDGSADIKVAETLTGLIRNIETASNAETAYISALESSARCGLGHLRVSYDYTDDNSFDMELAISAIRSPFAVLFDPFSQEPTKYDAEYCFVSALIPIEVYKKRFPKASLVDWDGGGNMSEWAGWREGNAIRVAEYYRKTMERRKLLMLASGAVVDVTDLPAADVQAMVAQTTQMYGQGVLRERFAEVPKVTMHLINGAEELEEPHVWPGRYIPIVPVVGEIVELGNRTVRRGLIRAARDPQIRYNAAVTAVTEYTMTMNKGKRILTPDQVEGHEDAWSNAHLSNRPYLLLNAPENPNVPHGGVAIQTEPPPAGLLADVQLAAMDIEAATGIYRENLGKETNAISGRAIMSRQREGDVGSYLYIDNLARAVAQVGKILVDAIPRIYDTPRMVRTLGEDGKTDFAPLNMAGPDGRIINDLSQGRYDVVASVGPMFSTKAEEARESIMAYMQADPTSAAMLGDLLAQYQDWPGADEISKRLRKRAVAQGLAEPEEGEQPPQPAPDPNMVLAQAEMVKAQASMAKAQGDAQANQAEMALKQAEVQLEARRVELETIRTLTDAKKTGAQIEEILASVRQGTAKLMLDARSQQDTVNDRRMGIMVDHHKAEADRAAVDSRQMRGHMMRGQMAQQRQMTPEMESDGESDD
jgi:hypothetical protein